VACLITLWISFGAPAQDNFNGSDPGQSLLNKHFSRASGDSLTLAIDSRAPLSDPATRARVEAALAPFARAEHVTSVTDPYRTPGHLSRNGHIAFATVQFDVASTKISNAEALALMHDAKAASGHGLTFSLGGDVVDLAETPYGGPSDGIGAGAAAVVLLIAFGSFLAMGLPILTALLGIGAGLSVIGLLGHIAPAPSFSPVIAAMIGLGVGVDYALFVVTRFKEGLQAGRAPEDAAVTAMRTAGRTVLIAGTTVVIGMMGLLVLRQPLLNGVAVAAAATVAMVLLGSLTLLPALLGFSGTRLAKRSRLLGWRRNRSATAGRSEKIPAAQRWAAMIQRRPVLATVVSTGIILVLAAPALGMKLNFPDESSQARRTMGYASYATMASGFGPGFDAPVIVAAALPAPGASTVRLAAAIRDTPGVASVGPRLVGGLRPHLDPGHHQAQVEPAGADPPGRGRDPADRLHRPQQPAAVQDPGTASPPGDLAVHGGEIGARNRCPRRGARGRGACPRASPGPGRSGSPGPLRLGPRRATAGRASRRPTARRPPAAAARSAR
jgi:uncharacterized membrane protein YdfJ with MMPL/SSD domain